MSRIQNFKRIITEDYEDEYKNLVSKLGSSINTFADEVTSALDNNLSIDDNLNIAKKTLTVTVDASGLPLSSTSVKSGLSGSCIGIQVIGAINLTNSTTSPTSTPFISYDDNGGVIKVNKITNLQANDKYQLNLILYT